MQQISLRIPWIYHPPAKCLSTGLTCLTHGLLHLFLCVFCMVFPIIIDLLNLYDEHLAQNQPHNGKYCVREKNSWWKRVAVAFFSFVISLFIYAICHCMYQMKEPSPLPYTHLHTSHTQLVSRFSGLPNNLLNIYIYIIDREWFA